ncbi:MAG: class I SAM-dependent methyltransferase [Bacteroidota bacterium]|nr:class I SAM-dependent methyltransferase [Bacteroidota bacterium]
MSLHQVSAFLSYRKNAISKHGVHSPFVFELVSKVFPKNRKEDISENIAEDWRTECRVNNSVINVTDLGTGNSGLRKISDIASKSAKSPKEGFLLHRIIKRFQPKKMLELGTSLGITTLHQASATSFGKFITLEGCPESAAFAKKAFQKYELPVEIRTGNFDETLPAALKDLGKLDYVFFDGNHREKPTLAYFELCLPYIHNDTLFIFDDIHWSEEMERAWGKIKAHPQARLTIDVFHFGLVFFRQEQKEKEHFVLKF